MKDLAQRLDELEAKLADAEQDQEWDRLEPDLRRLRLDVWSAVHQNGPEETLSWCDYLNPFDERTRVAVAERHRLEQDRRLAERLAEVVARFYTDKTRGFARTLIRVVEKLQRGVPGEWSTKASVAAGALLRAVPEAVDVDATLEVVSQAADRAAGHGLVAPSILSAVAYRPDALERLPERLSSFSSDEIDRALIGPSLLAADSTERVKEVRRQMQGRALEGDAILIAAAILSDRSPSDAWTHLSALEAIVLEDPLPRARIAAAAYTQNISPAELSERLQETQAIRFDRSGIGVAGWLLAEPERRRSAERLRRAALGTEDATDTLLAAGLNSPRPIDEVVALTRNVQQQLTGTWASEAEIIGAVLLQPGRVALHHAFLVPDWLSP